MNCGGSGDTPTLAHGVALNGTQSLPSLNTALAQYGTNSPPDRDDRDGLHLRRADHDRARHLGRHDDHGRVEPALEQHDHDDVGLLESASTFSAANPVHHRHPACRPTASSTCRTTPCRPVPTAPSRRTTARTPCFNPYQSAQPANSPQCLEGDVYIEGELHGQLTVASAANIMVTRDLTYACADGSGGASATDPSSVARRARARTPPTSSGCRRSTTSSSPTTTRATATRAHKTASPTASATGPGRRSTRRLRRCWPGSPTHRFTVSRGKNDQRQSDRYRQPPEASRVLSPGMTVTGTGIGIPAGTTVVDISGNTLTLSANATASWNGDAHLPRPRIAERPGRGLADPLRSDRHERCRRRLGCLRPERLLRRRELGRLRRTPTTST